MSASAIMSGSGGAPPSMAAMTPHRIERDGETMEPAEALAVMARRSLDGEEAEAISHGRAIGAEAEVVRRPAEPVALTFGGKLLAVARADGETIRPEVVRAAVGRRW